MAQTWRGSWPTQVFVWAIFSTGLVMIIAFLGLAWPMVMLFGVPIFIGFTWLIYPLVALGQRNA